jgi:class 3 adenylate cyclase
MGISIFSSENQNRAILKKEIHDLNLELPDAGTIVFDKTCCRCCVGIVDIVNSTRVAAHLSISQMCRYYSIFLNLMATIAKKYGAVVVKNIGDSLLYYFPETSDVARKETFIKCLDCGLMMVELHQKINNILAVEKLPSLDYRVSCDYGDVILAKSADSFHEDIFGTTVNVCSRINGIAAPNNVVIGGDLYTIVRGLPGFSFQEAKSCPLGFKFHYPVYSITYRGQQI